MSFTDIDNTDKYQIERFLNFLRTTLFDPINFPFRCRITKTYNSKFNKTLDQRIIDYTMTM